jgi:hypothetical protein
MAQMIRGELRLKSSIIARKLLHHVASVVDEDVQWTVTGQKLTPQAIDGGRIEQVQLAVFRPSAWRALSGGGTTWMMTIADRLRYDVGQKRRTRTAR